jgi:DNA-binding beta-propeller fold protein YncE
LRRRVVATILVGAAVALAAQGPSPGHDHPKDDTAAAWDAFQRAKQSEYRGPHRPRPRFAATVEEFPLQIPPGKELGRTIGVSVAPNGDIYLIQWSDRGVYIPLKKEARLPDVMRFDSSGRYITGWGAESVPDVDGISQWPRNPENVEVDADGNVWVTGYDPDDDAILKYSPDGKFLRRYGQHGKSGGDSSTEFFQSPPSVYHDVKNRELFIADGYGGRRVIAINSDTGKLTRMWSAYGKPPGSLKPGEGFSIPVHKIARSPDGLLYVCDRRNNRVQEFELVPGGVRYRREVYVTPGAIGMGSAADVAFTPDNRFMFVSDMMGMRVWTVDRKSFEVLGWANAAPEHEGDDNIAVNKIPVHRMALLPNGDLLLTRTRRGVQRLKFIGVS